MSLVLATMAQAQQEPAGVTVQWIASPADQAAWGAAVQARLRAPLTEALRRAVLGSVDTAASDIADPGLLLNLRELPAKLSDGGSSRYVVCLQPRQDGERITVEIAVCDRVRAILLSYKALDFALTESESQLSSGVAEVVAGSLPEAARPGPRTWHEPTPRSEAMRDAPLASLAGVPAGDWSDVALESLTVAGGGDATGPVRVLHHRQAFAGSRLGTEGEQPLEVSVWRVGEDTQVEFTAPTPLPTFAVPRRGAWVAVDLEGLKVASSPAIQVGRSGLITVTLKPTETGQGTRLGFELTDAAEIRLTTRGNGRTLCALIGKDVATPPTSLVNPTPPFEGDYDVVRSFSGMASWYGRELHGRRTASGEPFNANGWTAAHRTLPLGTWLKVTNTANGKSAIVRVNDRGPYSHGRVLDVSAACARGLGFAGRGVAHVSVAVLRRQ